ncbi:cobalamin biosynthesis protein CbiX [Kitasatospora sp. NPDC059795]|uniref:cobalamin biosynthesis protein CbiX n=1 Tax=Kitasatospora sp. NPDC059795 TaxID=3346949 RepID=UPI00364D9C0F
MADRIRVLAVCGHEAAGGAALHHLTGPDTAVVGTGRALYRALAADPARQGVAVVPMTLGRDPELVADTARTVRALPPDLRGGVAVAAPFGTSEHLVGWLRAAAATVPTAAALLLTAPGADPYQDAELFRVAHLVQRHGRHRLVETALLGDDLDAGEGVRRCALLGARAVAVLSASFLPPGRATAPDGVSVTDAGPLLGPAALAAVLSARAADAVRRLRENRDDGIGRALVAADGHGLAHTHGPGADHDHHHGPGDHEHHHRHGPGEGRSPDHSPQAQHTHSSPDARPLAATGARSHQ